MAKICMKILNRVKPDLK